MTRWTERSSEEARLFNPAFLVTLLSAAVGSYEARAGDPMPWLLAFLIPPLTLPQRTREALPGSINAHLAGWLDANPDVRLAFARRAPALTPLTKEALRLGLHTGVLTLQGANLHAAHSPGGPQETSDEVAACIKAARFFGRWFGSRHDPTTIYGLLGVRP